MNNQKHTYFLHVARSLAACQRVELELKLYIARALDLVLTWVAGRMTFKIVGLDYKDATLERLIETFKKLTSNSALVKDLNKFKNDRNFVAHKAIVACLDLEGGLKESAVVTIERRLKKIEKEATRLGEAIYAESLKFAVYDYIDDKNASR